MCCVINADLRVEYIYIIFKQTLKYLFVLKLKQFNYSKAASHLLLTRF